MQEDTRVSNRFFQQSRGYFLLPLAIILYIISVYNFTLFLFLTSLFSIMLAFAIFIFTVNVPESSIPSFLEILGTVFIYVSILESISIFGMIPPGKLAIQSQLWASAQFMEAIAFLVMIVSLYRRPSQKIDHRLLYLAYTLLFTLALLSIFYWHTFPQFGDANHLAQTPAETSIYGSIAVILVFSMVGLWRKRHLFDPHVFNLFVAFIVAAILSNLIEPFFAVSPLLHATSHVLNIAGLYALFRVIVVLGLTNPYSLLLRDLKNQKDHLEEHVEARTQALAKEMAHHKETARQLTESEARYRRLVERAPDWIYRYRLTEPPGYEWSNPVIEDMTGYTAEEVCSRPDLFLSLAHPEDRTWWQSQKHNWEGFPWHEEIITRLIINGKTLWLEERLIPVYDDTGKLIAAEGIGRDISQQKQIETTLRHRTSELEFLIHANKALSESLALDDTFSTILDEVRHLLDISFCSIWLIDPKTKDLVCRDITAPYREKFRGTRDPQGKGLTGWVVKNRRTLNVNDTSKLAPDIEIYMDLGDFDYLNKSVLSIPLQSKQHIIGVLQIIDDHINRFAPEEISLLESLASIAANAIDNARLYNQAISDAQTKLTLLKEVNHRVKNNLAAISGLIYLEKSNSIIKTDENYQETMDNLISRVRGLSAIHNLLSSTEWQPVLLKTLVESIINETIRATASQLNVILSITVPALKIDPEQAHHLSMVLNELTINSFKHAKIGESHRLEITIGAHINESFLHLTFKDSGTGFPKRILESPFVKNHVGFELIHGIVKNNLQGTVSLKNEGGALVSLSLKLKTLRALTD